MVHQITKIEGSTRILPKCAFCDETSISRFFVGNIEPYAARDYSVVSVCKRHSALEFKDCFVYTEEEIAKIKRIEWTNPRDNSQMVLNKKEKPKCAFCEKQSVANFHINLWKEEKPGLIPTCSDHADVSMNDCIVYGEEDVVWGTSRDIPVTKPSR